MSYNKTYIQNISYNYTFTKIKNKIKTLHTALGFQSSNFMINFIWRKEEMQ